MRTLTINYGLGVENQPNHYGFEIVDECGRTTGALCLGELIEQVTCLVHPKLNEVRYAMADVDGCKTVYFAIQDGITERVAA